MLLLAGFVSVVRMEREATASGILRGTRTSVEELLLDLSEVDPSELDCLAYEKKIMAAVMELGLKLMREVLRRADECAPEVEVNGAKWGNRQVSKGTYTTKFGTLVLALLRHISHEEPHQPSA